MRESLYQLEKKKIKGRKIGLMVTGVILLQLIWLLTCYRPPLTEKELTDGYYVAVMNIATMNAICCPLLMAAIASRTCEIEHKGSNFKMLYTLMERKKLFDVKLLLGLRYIGFIGLAQFVIFFIVSSIIGFKGEVPWFSCIWIPVLGILMNTALFLMQEVLSFWFENQMIPLAIGLFGSFLGIMSLFIEQIRQMTFWAYYTLLATVNMDWNEKTRIITYYEIPMQWGKIAIVLGVIATCYCVGKWIVVNRKEV